MLAYGLEALRALGHLHDLGLLYCDFKPDNAIHTGDHLKLIDLGGVRRIDDADGPVYGTVGYQAPEIAEQGPSVASDLYTVARTMAVLSFEFTGYTGRYRASLPPRHRVGVLAGNPSYDRLLRRAAHPSPTERFASAAEMAEQVAGVLAEVLAGSGGGPRPWRSGLFEAGPPAAVVGPGALPAAAWVADALPVPDLELAEERGQPVAPLRAAVGEIAWGDHTAARAMLAGGTEDWRYYWYRGIGELLAGEPTNAGRHFDRVHSLIPGESAPRLALALCDELRGDHATAARRHGAVWRTDPSYLTAAFGLARTRFALGEREAAVEALCSVPESSGHYADAQSAAIVATLGGRPPAGIGLDELAECAERLERLDLAGEPHHRLTVLILRAALARLAARPPSGRGGAELFGLPLTEHHVRAGLDRAYRALARLSEERRDRVALVDMANAVRPRTLLLVLGALNATMARRHRRLVNPAVALATMLACGLAGAGGWLLPALDQDLRTAREGAFTATRAFAAVRAAERDELAGRHRAELDPRSPFPAGRTAPGRARELDAVRPSLIYSGSMVGNELTLHEERRLRVSYEEAPERFFGPYDRFLVNLIEVNRREMDRLVDDRRRVAELGGLIPPAAAVVLAGLLVAGVRPRLAEYR